MARTEHRLIPLAALLALAAAGVVGAAATRGGEEVARALRLKPDAARGAQLYSACTACHGTDAGGEPNGSVPRLAGQHAPVLIQQIIDFRGGRRWDLRMEQVVSRHQLNDAQAVADVAGYIAALAPQLAATPGSGGQLEHGAELYKARCQECHGATGEGTAATRTPRIAGQHAAYLMRQMQEAAGGGRPNMGASHRALLAGFELADYQGLSDYLSRLPGGA
jgi:cytochrome c553